MLRREGPADAQSGDQRRHVVDALALLLVELARTGTLALSEGNRSTAFSRARVGALRGWPRIDGNGRASRMLTIVSLVAMLATTGASLA